MQFRQGFSENCDFPLNGHFNEMEPALSFLLSQGKTSKTKAFESPETQGTGRIGHMLNPGNFIA